MQTGQALLKGQISSTKKGTQSVCLNPKLTKCMRRLGEELVCGQFWVASDLPHELFELKKLRFKESRAGYKVFVALRFWPIALGEAFLKREHWNTFQVCIRRICYPCSLMEYDNISASGWWITSNYPFSSEASSRGLGSLMLFRGLCAHRYTPSMDISLETWLKGETLALISLSLFRQAAQSWAACIPKEQQY